MNENYRRRCVACNGRRKAAWFPWDGKVCAPCINTGKVVVDRTKDGITISLRPQITQIVVKGVVSAS